MKTLITSLMVTAMLMVSQFASAAETFIKGKDYHEISYPVPTRDSSKIEVIELFWYGCGHCYKFEPMVNSWAKTVSSDVDFHHQPGDFGGWGTETQLHYAMEALGVLTQGRALLFNEYHVLKNKLRSHQKRVKFFKLLGVSEEVFTKVWESFTVQSKVKMAQARTRAYRATGVPAMVVNGKYRIDTRSAGGFKRMLEIVDYLIKQERAKL
jgi:thiol:disulfide interchange protein DsbA